VLSDSANVECVKCSGDVGLRLIRYSLYKPLAWAKSFINRNKLRSSY